MIDDASGDDLPSKLANFTRQVAVDKRQYQEKIRNLEQMLVESSADKDLPKVPPPSLTGTTNLQQDIPGLSGQSRVSHVSQAQACSSHYQH